MGRGVIWEETFDTEPLDLKGTKKWATPTPSLNKENYTSLHWIRQGHESQWKVDTHIFHPWKESKVYQRGVGSSFI